MNYLTAERKLNNGNTLFFRQDNSSDIVLIESKTQIKSGKDITKWNPEIVGWDELFDGRQALEQLCNGLPKIEQTTIKNKIYDNLTNLYEKRVSLTNSSILN